VSDAAPDRLDAAVTELDPRAPGMAEAIRGLMAEAYAVEAAILGLDDFPPLHRTVADLAGADSRFLGVWEAGALVAVAELDVSEPAAVTIDSLVVRPSRFRKGLGTALLDAIEGLPSATVVRVSTAAGNLPALALYLRLGFEEERTWMTPDGIPMITFARAASADTKGSKAKTEGVA